eukprot:COSAG06_NODE_1120_length_10630_cov_130.014244_3_plen_211_part_00
MARCARIIIWSLALSLPTPLAFLTPLCWVPLKSPHFAAATHEPSGGSSASAAWPSGRAEMPNERGGSPQRQLALCCRRILLPRDIVAVPSAGRDAVAREAASMLLRTAPAGPPVQHFHTSTGASFVSLQSRSTIALIAPILAREWLLSCHACIISIRCMHMAGVGSRRLAGLAACAAVCVWPRLPHATCRNVQILFLRGALRPRTLCYAS